MLGSSILSEYFAAIINNPQARFLTDHPLVMALKDGIRLPFLESNLPRDAIDNPAQHVAYIVLRDLHHPFYAVVGTLEEPERIARLRLRNLLCAFIVLPVWKQDIAEPWLSRLQMLDAKYS